MAEIARFSGHREWIDVDFVERERTPEQAMALGIRTHLAGLSLSNTVDLLDALGVQRSRKAIRDWVQRADLQPDTDQSPNHVALDQTVIRSNHEQYWLYAAADPETDHLLHVRLCSTTTTAPTEVCHQELREKHDVETAVFLADGAHHRQTTLHRAGLRYQMSRHGNRNAVERLFRELKRRTSSFSNCFSHVEPETAESWLQASACWQNTTN
jgi:putative transposase